MNEATSHDLAGHSTLKANQNRIRNSYCTYAKAGRIASLTTTADVLSRVLVSELVDNEGLAVWSACRETASSSCCCWQHSESLTQAIHVTVSIFRQVGISAFLGNFPAVVEQQQQQLCGSLRPSRLPSVDLLLNTEIIDSITGSVTHSDTWYWAVYCSVAHGATELVWTDVITALN